MMLKNRTYRSLGEESACLCGCLFAGNLVIGLFVMWSSPYLGELLRSIVVAWGSIAQIAVPSIQYISNLTSFQWEAWCASLVVWSVMPVGAYAVWRSKSLWEPDKYRMRRQPLILVFCVLLFAFVVVGMMRYSPMEQSLSGFGVARRMLSMMISSKLAYVSVLAFIATGVSIAAGLFIQALQLAHNLFRLRHC